MVLKLTSKIYCQMATQAKTDELTENNVNIDKNCTFSPHSNAYSYMIIPATIDF